MRFRPWRGKNHNPAAHRRVTPAATTGGNEVQNQTHGCVSTQGCIPRIRHLKDSYVIARAVPIHGKSKDTPNAHLKCALLLTNLKCTSQLELTIKRKCSNSASYKTFTGGFLLFFIRPTPYIISKTHTNHGCKYNAQKNTPKKQGQEGQRQKEKKRIVILRRTSSSDAVTLEETHLEKKHTIRRGRKWSF